MLALIDGANWAEILTAIGTLGIAAGFFVAAFQLRESRRSRNAAIAVEVVRTWESQEMLAARDIVSKLTAEELQRAYSVHKAHRDADFHNIQRVANFLEYLGALEKGGYVDKHWINDTIGTAVIDGWEKWYLCARDERANLSATAYENFYRLAVLVSLMKNPRWNCVGRGVIRTRKWLARIVRVIWWELVHQSPPNPYRDRNVPF